MEVAPADPIGELNARNPGLSADGPVAHVEIPADRIDRLLDVVPVGVAVDQHPVAALPAEQIVERHARGLGLDVPQGHIDRSDRPHRDRTAPPIGAAIEKLPDILDPERIAADQRRHDMILEIGDHGLLATVKRRIADAMDASVGFDLERHEVAPGTCHDDTG